MSEKSTVEIEAPLDEVARAVFDVENYPTWSSTIKKVENITKDGDGRVSAATLSVDSGVVKDRVSLEYDNSGYPKVTSFSLSDGDLMTKMDGSFTLAAIDADTTSVTYELDTDVSMPVPRMMISKVEKQTIETTLSQLKAHLES